MKVLVACFPKSGSTFLTNLINNIDGFSTASWVPSYGHREQELAETMIIGGEDASHQVAQHHVRASDYTLQILDRHDVKVIVLVRNIFDCMVSLAEHTKLQSHVYPMAFIEERMQDASFDERLDAVVDLASPWYLNFYASWYSTRPSRIIRYEDIVLADNEQRAQVLSRLDVPICSEKLSAAARDVPPGTTRFNVGRAGRGESLLNRRQIQRITDLARHYKSIDFSPIGISYPLPPSKGLTETRFPERDVRLLVEPA